MPACPHCGQPLSAERRPAARTPAQQRVLAAVRELTARRGFSPTVREIGATVGLSSSSTVHTHLAALRAQGLVQWEVEKSRSLRVVG